MQGAQVATTITNKEWNSVVIHSRGWQVIDAERRCIEAFNKKGVLELQFGHNILYSPEGIVGGCR